MDPASSLPRSTVATAPAVAAAPAEKRSAIYHLFSILFERSIHFCFRIAGKRIRKTDFPWLNCPLGDRGPIGASIYERIAREENLQLKTPRDAGLITDFNALRGPNFDPAAIHPAIRHFYEHTAGYHLEVWTEVSLLGRFFLWLLVEFISRRMDQLNFPISSLEVAKGMSSEVVQLIDPAGERASERLAYTGWLRRLKSSGHVIYAGLYSTVQVPGETDPCVKVTFPCDGSANVYLSPVAHPDGSFGLDSSGSAWGRSGFYRVFAAGADHCRIRYIKTLHELFRVYVDNEGILRTDHTISFLGLTIIRLHYKMSPASAFHP